MWQVIGQTRAVSLLRRGLEGDSLAHAYLLIGPTHVGKMTLAINLAQALNCEAIEPPCGECVSCQRIALGKHADVQVIDLNHNRDTSSEAKPQKEISIEQIRQVQHVAVLPPFEGRYKVFIIDGAELLSTEAANCLLKTLEEPVGKTVFILLTNNERILPATVVSRCQRVELLPMSITQVETLLNKNWSLEPQKAKLLAKLSHGCLGWAISAILDNGLLQRRADYREEVLDIINSDYEERFIYAAQLATQFSQNRGLVQEKLNWWLDWWRDLLLINAGCNTEITNVDRLATLIDMARGYSLAQIRTFISNIRMAVEQLRQNANPQLVLEVLMLSIPTVEKGVEKVP